MVKLMMLLLMLLLTFGGFVSHAQPATLETINAATIADLELGYVLPFAGYCHAFSADDRLIGNYDTTTGEMLFRIDSFAHDLDADANIGILQPEAVAALTPETRIDAEALSVVPERNLLLVQRLGAFELTSGLRLLDFYGFSSLSPDGSMLALPNVGIYDTRDWTLKFPLNSDAMVSFSPDKRLFAVAGNGVYSVENGERLFRISGAIPVFSPDSQWLVVERDGLYNVERGERILALENDPFVVPQFSSDSRWLADARGVYDVHTGEQQFEMDIWNSAAFSPDSQSVVGADGGYALPSGEPLFELSGASVNFNVDGSLIASVDNHIYDTATGEAVFTTLGLSTFSPAGNFLSVKADTYCLVYGLPDADYPYRSGLVMPYSGANVRVRPSASGSIVFSTREMLAVSAQTADGQWFKVFSPDGEGWVAAEAVEIIEMPDGVPVETP